MENEDRQYRERVQALLERYLLGKGYASARIRRDFSIGRFTLDMAVADDEGPCDEAYLCTRSEQGVPCTEGDGEAIVRAIVAFNRKRSGEGQPRDTAVSRGGGSEAELYSMRTRLYYAGEQEGRLCIREHAPFFKTVSEYIDRLIAPDQKLYSTFYRGHSNARDFFLQPGVYRSADASRAAEPEGESPASVDNEHIFYKEAIRRCPAEFESLRSTFEQLVKMQHYNIPTRLLDITTNPLVALYFACAAHPKVDGEVYSFAVPRQQVKYFDSDAVSVVANLARLPSLTLCEGEESHSRSLSHLLHEIRYEKPHFADGIDPSDLSRVLCVLPRLNNPRIIRQQGAFFLFGIDGEKGRMAPFRYPFRRYLVPARSKRNMLRDLAKLGIDSSTLFPELETVAGFLKSSNG